MIEYNAQLVALKEAVLANVKAALGEAHAERRQHRLDEAAGGLSQADLRRAPR